MVQTLYLSPMTFASVNLNRIVLFFAAFAAGAISGLRSMTAIAVIAWGARWGWLDLHSTSLAFIGRNWFLYAATAGALGELVADKLPFIPSRTAPAPLAFRFLTGGLSGAAIFVSAKQPFALGAILGILGALLGAFEGYHLRRQFTKEKGFRDFQVALAEDLIAVGGAFLLISHLF